MGENKEVAFLKRNAINKANQTMFLAVAGAALIAGASVVGMIYLFRILYNDILPKRLKGIKYLQIMLKFLVNKIKVSQQFKKISKILKI